MDNWKASFGTLETAIIFHIKIEKYVKNRGNKYKKRSTRCLPKGNAKENNLSYLELQVTYCPPISRNKKIKVESPEQRRDGNPNRCQITHSTHSNPMSLNAPQYP